MSGLYGNATGGFGNPKTYILTDENGKEITGVLVDNVTVFDATTNDVRLGRTYAGDEGVKIGTKDIPIYRAEQGLVTVAPNESFSILLNQYKQYDYTKLQCVISKFNTTLNDSVAVDKVVIEDSVYATGSTTVLASVTKNPTTKSIDLNITNNTSNNYVLRYFTYRKED